MPCPPERVITPRASLPERPTIYIITMCRSVRDEPNAGQRGAHLQGTVSLGRPPASIRQVPGQLGAEAAPSTLSLSAPCELGSGPDAERLLELLGQAGPVRVPPALVARVRPHLSERLDPLLHGGLSEPVDVKEAREPRAVRVGAAVVLPLERERRRQRLAVSARRAVAAALSGPQVQAAANRVSAWRGVAQLQRLTRGGTSRRR